MSTETLDRSPQVETLPPTTVEPTPHRVLPRPRRRRTWAGIAGVGILTAVAVVVVWQRPWTSEPLIGFQGDWKDVMIEQEARVPSTGDWKDLVIDRESRANPDTNSTYTGDWKDLVIEQGQ